MAADDLFETDPNLWVDIRVSRIRNRTDAFDVAEDAARSDGVAGFIGDGMYAEAAQVAGRFHIPICEGLDTRQELSDRAKYPTLFRTIPSIESELAAVYSLVRYLGFTKVAIVPADNYTDTSSVFIMASKYNLSVQALYLEPETATGCSRIEQSLRANTASDAMIVVLILSKHFAATCLETVAANANLVKKATWVLDQAAMAVVSSSVKSSGMFAVSRIEGSGEAYANVLSKWRDPAYQSRYPHISAFDVPPAGFMFVRSCLEVMISGFNQKLLKAGLQSIASRQMNVPSDFSFPSLETSTGRIDFRPGTTDRAGSFNIHYHNGTNFVLVGVLNESMHVDLRQSLDTFGWVNASGPSLVAGDAGRSNTSLVVGLSVGGGILFLALAAFIIYRCCAGRSDPIKLTAEEEVGLQSNANNIGINVSGTGQQALNILARMKEQDQKKNRPCLTDFQIQILTDALTSGGNSAYDPTFELSPTNGPPVDAELQEFLMNTMLATGKRRTAVDGHLIPISNATLSAIPINQIPLHDDDLPFAPGLSREKSLFKQLKSSAQSLVSNRLHDTEAGPREGSEAASPEGSHFKSDRTEELKLTSAAKFAMKREFSNESYLLAGSVARSKTTKGGLKSLNSQQQPSLARRISTFATHAFSPAGVGGGGGAAGMSQSPVKDSFEPKEFAMSPLSSSVFIAMPDLNRPYFESKFMQDATEDLQTISIAPIHDYLNSSCLTWEIGK
ncbi:hypothetical protein HDU81_005009 [Chytriomyces hyalinus]|nr:hypothetical protein HDU81_005009 [Chytriomyces hyalinus]